MKYSRRIKETALRKILPPENRSVSDAAREMGVSDQLGNTGKTADIAFSIRIFIPPLSGGFTEERHVEDVCLGCIDQNYLFPAQLRWNQVFFDGIGIDQLLVTPLRAVSAHLNSDQSTS